MEIIKNMEKEQYERAINAYNEHVSRYKEWMHLYSIFTGAFFVAYCNVFDKNAFLSLVIIVVGLIASICWLGSFLGYYSWMKSWINILQKREKDYLFAEKEKHRIYSIVDKEKIQKHGYSTQKITKCFIITIIIGWTALYAYQIHEITKNYKYAYYWILIGVLIIIILFLLVLIITKSIYSDVDSMEDLENSQTTKEK